MKKVKIKLDTIHSFENKQEKISYSANASLINTAKHQVISYIDPSLNNEDRVVIKSNNDQVKIIRQGSIKSEMVFNRKEKSYGLYELDGLVLNLQMSLKDFASNSNNINLVYDLYIDGQLSGVFETKIKINH